MDAPTLEPPRKRAKMVLADLFILPVELQLDVMLKALLPKYEKVAFDWETREFYSRARMFNAIEQVKLLHRRYEAFAGDLRLREIVRSKFFRLSLYRLWLSQPTPDLWYRGNDPRTALSVDVARHSRDLPDGSEFQDKANPDLLNDRWFSTYVADTYANDYLRWVLMSAWRLQLRRQRFEEQPMEIREVTPLFTWVRNMDRKYVMEHQTYTEMRQGSFFSMHRAETARVLAPGVKDLLVGDIFSLRIYDLRTVSRRKGLREAAVLEKTFFPSHWKANLSEELGDLRERIAAGESADTLPVGVVTRRNFVMAVSMGSVIRQPTLWWFDGLHRPRGPMSFPSIHIAVASKARRRHFVFDAPTPAVSQGIQKQLAVDLGRDMTHLRRELLALTPGDPYVPEAEAGEEEDDEDEPGAKSPGPWHIMYAHSSDLVATGTNTTLKNVRLMSGRNFTVWMRRLWRTSENLVSASRHPSFDPSAQLWTFLDYPTARLYIFLQSVSFSKGDAFDPPRILVTPEQWATIQKLGDPTRKLDGSVCWYCDAAVKALQGERSKEDQEIMLVSPFEKRVLDKRAKKSKRDPLPHQLLEVWLQPEQGPPHFVHVFPLKKES